MRILLLILTFVMCYVCDPLQENDTSCAEMMAVDSTEAIYIDLKKFLIQFVFTHYHNNQGLNQTPYS